MRRREAPGETAFLKTLKKPRDTRSRKRFYREISAYRTISHPNVPVRLDDNAEHWEDTKVDLFVVTEFVTGPTLDDYVASNEVDLAAAIEMTSTVAGVLAACHAEQIVHRDLKPRNVIIRDGIVW